MRSLQIPTFPTTLRDIMRDEDFKRGVIDVRSGRGYPPDFDAVTTRRQWDYERGRQWAVAAGLDVYLLDADGEPTAEAMAIYRRAGIL